MTIALLCALFASSANIALADCSSGTWACSPLGDAAGSVDGGGMYQCVGGWYQQQTSCSVGAKCCASGDQVKCVPMSATCATATTEPDACDIHSTNSKTCCSCDTGSMCLGASNTYRKCVNGCFQELSCGTTKICGQITQKCAASQTKCTKPGSVDPAKKPDGANYLNICGIDYTANEIQCSLTLKQKEAAACYQAQTNGLSTALSSIKSDDGFTITSQRMQTGVDDSFKPIYGNTKFVINDSNGTTDCQNLGQPLQSREAAANEIRSKLGCAASRSEQTGSSLCQSLELACCLTSDRCQSYGCDENIVYDPYYGCTKVDFGKQLIKTKEIPFNISSCPKTACSPSGAILVLDASFAATACNYKASIDKNQSECLKCHKDATTNEAVCDQTKPAPTAVNKCGGVVCGQSQVCLNGKCVANKLTLDASKFNGKLTASQAAQEICRQVYANSPTSDLEILADRLADCRNLVGPYTDKNGNFDMKTLSDINKQLATKLRIQEVGQFSVLPNEIGTGKDKDMAAKTFTPYTWSASENKWVADTKPVVNTETASGFPRNSKNDNVAKIQSFVKEYYVENKIPYDNDPHWTCVDDAVMMVNAARKKGIPAYVAGDVRHAFVAFDVSGSMSAWDGSDPSTNQEGGVFAPQEFILFEPRWGANASFTPLTFGSMKIFDICKNFDYFLSKPGNTKSGDSDFSCHNRDAVHFVAQGVDPNTAANLKNDPESYYTSGEYELDPNKTAGNVTAKQQYLTYSTQTVSDSDTGVPQSSLTLDVSKFGSKMTGREAQSEIYSQLYPLTPATSLDLMTQRMAAIQELTKPYIDSEGFFDLNKFAQAADNASFVGTLSIVGE